MQLKRRDFLTGASIAGIAARNALADIPQPPIPLSVAATSPWMASSVALTSKNVMFLGLPRYPGYEDTPSLVRVEQDGKLTPFPGGAWNGWKHGDDGLNSLVYANSVRIFADDTVWCVDQGSLISETSAPGIQKLVQFDPASGKSLRVLRFSPEILPPYARLGHPRMHGSMIYITDEGLGGIIVHDLTTGMTLRRLGGYKIMGPLAVHLHSYAKNAKSHPGIPHSDRIEISADGSWLYWAANTGPLYRLPTALLRDPHVTDAELATKIEKTADTPIFGGSSMDTLGNLYMSIGHVREIQILTRSAQRAVLVSDQELVSPDESFISQDRHLYIPSTQQDRTPMHTGGANLVKLPFKIYRIKLPTSFNGITLGDAITGAEV